MVHINPRQVRDFARSVGRVAKTDVLDARVIAHFAEAVGPEPRRLPDEQSKQLGSFLSRRRQVSEMLTAEKDRLQTAVGPVRRRIGVHVRWLQKELSGIDD